MARTWKDNFVYDVFLWLWTIVIDLFFREIHPRTSYRIPKNDPVIFVAAPHANQFVDPLILGGTVRHDAKRRISFLIAEKSLRRKFVGFASRLVGSVGVGRALDLKKPAKGKIWLPDPEEDATLIKGKGTEFTDSKQFMKGGLLVLPSVNNEAANTEIQEVISDEEIRLKKPFKGDVAYKQLTGQSLEESNGQLSNGDSKKEEFDGIKFSVAPHVDQSKVYEAVFNRLKEGGCIGIFPEGGSHDRTELLPLKAGVAIMALGALAENPDCGVKIVPVGMNYFHPHKFRSRCVIEFGKPITVPLELVEQYKGDGRRAAIQSLLDTVTNGLKTVTTLAPDYDTLMLIQAVRRLYNPKGKNLPLSMTVELNRRLIKGYNTYKDDPRVVSLRTDVLDYNRQLFHLGIRDHQVGYAKHSWYKVIFLLLWRTFKLACLSLAVLPGTVLFAPIFVIGKLISIKKSREALAASTVKIRARDVIATWKILVALALTPILDVTYTCLLTWWCYYNRVGVRVSESLPLTLITIGGLFFFPATCFMALRFGEVGMDIFKSLRPLFLSISPSSSNILVRMAERRENLSRRISDLVNELGPELFPDFERERLVHDREQARTPPPEISRPSTPTSPLGREDGNEIDSLTFTPATPPSYRNQRSPEGNLPRNESFKNIGSIGLFASRPPTPNRSRSRASSGSWSSPLNAGTGFGGKLKRLTSLKSNAKKPPTTKDSKDDEGVKKTGTADLEEVSRNLHAAMRERGRRRKSESGSEGWVEFERSDDGGITPMSEMDGDEVEEDKKGV
ncbi:Glycerol-3-phosphate/dihydroxyacetone phosphate acyltransferase [Saxophila tyrrhenica]|uniref:Glycerol-3-phosphate/dihydroxyacetone phosphate acyltransferase n=1 Tax=Saxophila tyrrhenica TaxID=1690608 RepID=A0AAV9PN98_9PEZI|nr:Glycerol-3-phosphate/dihydroxyacetone phosphate acyltransferase [Saxophila tyrrhenica]